MKNLILFSLLSLCIISCDYINNQINQSKIVRSVKVREKINPAYKGNVKRIVGKRCKGYSNNDNNNVEIDYSSCWIDFIKEFNYNGTLIKEFSLAGIDDTIGLRTINLDENGNISEDIDIGEAFETKNDNLGNFKVLNNKVKVTKKTTYSYNRDGFKTEYVDFKDGKLKFRTETIYDEFNCTIKQISYSDNNIPYDTIIYEYDKLNRKILSEASDGRWKTEKKYYSNDENSGYTEIEYENGQMKSKIEIKDKRIFDKVLELTDTIRQTTSSEHNFIFFPLNFNVSDIVFDKLFEESKYAGNNKIKNLTIYYNDNNNSIVFAEFDEDERVVEVKINFDGGWGYTIKWNYREDGFPLEKSITTSKVVGKPYYKITEYYTPDKYGNWTKLVIKDNEGKVYWVDIREIEYY